VFSNHSNIIPSSVPSKAGVILPLLDLIQNQQEIRKLGSDKLLHVLLLLGWAKAPYNAVDWLTISLVLVPPIGWWLLLV
jgi:hypothetical protein